MRGDAKVIEHLNRAMTAHGDLRHDSAQAASRYLLAAVHRDLGRLDEARGIFTGQKLIKLRLVFNPQPGTH